MQSSFAVVAHRIGRLIEIRARGMFTLYDAATMVRRVRAACEEVGGSALIVGDLRRSRAVGDEIVPILFGALRDLDLPITRAGFLVDRPPGALPQESDLPLTTDPCEQSFYEATDLLRFMVAMDEPEEQLRIEQFLEEGNRFASRRTRPTASGEPEDVPGGGETGGSKRTPL